MARQKNKTPIIIDTDPGHDDALAIMLLERSGLVEIKAVTTVAGNSTIQNVTNNARYILDLLSCPVPIYSGANKPLKRKLINAVVHGNNGLDGAKINKQELLNNKAVDKIISLVRKNPKKLSIVVIGPETNIAQAFIKDPQLPSLIKQLVIMGGAIIVPGNKNRVAEFNIFVDPEAADIVFRAPIKKILIPLDLCNEVILQMEYFQKIKNSNLYQPLLKMMEKFIQGILIGEKVNGALVYDALAAYYLINPQAYTLEPMDIKIETTSDLTRGMTVVERRTWVNKNPNVQVAIKINKKYFLRDFIKILGK